MPEPTDTETLAEVHRNDTERAALAEDVLRLRCRCGRMWVDPAPTCEWHKARIERAALLRRELGSYEEIPAARIVQARAGEGALRARVADLLRRAELQDNLSLSCDFNGNRWETPISQADLRAALTATDQP